MPTVYSRFHYGASKIVVLEPGFHVADCHVMTTTLYASQQRRIKNHKRACSDMDFLLMKKGWSIKI